MRFGGIWLFGCLAWPLTAAAANAPLRQDLRPYFTPDRTSQVVLAPDGRHFAYTIREGRSLRLMMVDLTRPDRRALAFMEEDQIRALSKRTVLAPVLVPFLDWVDSDRLLYLITLPSSDGRGSIEELRIVDADGHNSRKLVGNTDVEGRFFPPSPDAEPIPIPRRMRVVRIERGPSPQVIIEAKGSSMVGSSIGRVDIASGRLVLGKELDKGRYLTDRSGAPRVLEPPRLVVSSETPRNSQVMENVPGEERMIAMMPKEPARIQRQDFRVVAAQGSGRWQLLDRLTNESVPLVFHHDDGNYFAPRSVPLAFDHDPNTLYFASNIGRDTFGVYALDLRTGRRTGFSVESNDFDVIDPSEVFSDGPLVFDRDDRLLGVRLAGGARGTRWFDAAWAHWQEQLEQRFPGRRVRVLGWTDDRSRLLVLTDGETDPGRYFVYDPADTSSLREIARRNPAIAAPQISTTEPIDFVPSSGLRLTGTLTLPARPMANPAPVILLCRDIGRPAAVMGGFSREAQAFAAIGFLVAQIDYRGSSGWGSKHREAIKAGFDRVPLEDLSATLEWLSVHHPYDHRRVAVVGNGFGGYLALRAVQLQPDRYRCAVSLNAPTDLAQWLREGDVTSDVEQSSVVSLPVALRRTFFAANPGELQKLSLRTAPSTFTRAVMIVQDPDSSELWPSHGRELRDAIRKAGGICEYLETTGEYARGEPDALAKVYTQISGFITNAMYGFKVDVGRPEEVR